MKKIIFALLATLSMSCAAQDKTLPLPSKSDKQVPVMNNPVGYRK